MQTSALKWQMEREANISCCSSWSFCVSAAVKDPEGYGVMGHGAMALPLAWERAILFSGATLGFRKA